MARLEGHTRAVARVALSQDGRLPASGAMTAMTSSQNPILEPDRVFFALDRSVTLSELTDTTAKRSISSAGWPGGRADHAGASAIRRADTGPRDDQRSAWKRAACPPAGVAPDADAGPACEMLTSGGDQYVLLSILIFKCLERDEHGQGRDRQYRHWLLHEVQDPAPDQRRQAHHYEERTPGY
jgi:hypothetical protein